ncbi:neurogenic locus protein delta-like [Actinia tenebrosa]|uniref:Neurogenic locus protein delta-like n=1 Tax=Actinia tenebrosa TaxID=6105 RepID=A0A6P8HPM7_ACTTE|nr:neurogenic locus protein delta-like [Actinia tenebrosa]
MWMTCTNAIGNYSCACAVGWQGENCDQDIDECFLNQCRGYAVCNNTIGNYSCACVKGWQGENCDQDVDECLTNPCLNEGTCVNVDGNYICSCKGSWKGRHCDQQELESRANKLADTQVYLTSLPFVISVFGIAILIVWRKYRKMRDPKSGDQLGDDNKKALSLDDFPEELVHQEYGGFLPADPWNSDEGLENSYFAGRYLGYAPIDQTASDDDFSMDSFTEDIVLWDRQSLERMQGNMYQTAEDPEMEDETQNAGASRTGMQIPLEHEEESGSLEAINQQERTIGDTMSEDETLAGSFVLGKVRVLEAAFEKRGLKRD